MVIKTRDFGELTIDDAEIITISPPILGFDTEDKFAMLIDDEADGMFSFLQSISNSEVCFVLTNPEMVFNTYKPIILPQVLKGLGAKDKTDTVVRVITVIPDDFLKATVNLKSPIVLCPSTRCATQIILDEDYPLRAPLCEMEG